MNKHEKTKTHKIGRIALTGLTALTIAGIGAGVACIVTAGGNSQESTDVKTSTSQTSTSQTSTSQVVTESSSKEPEITKKTPGVPNYTEFKSDPIQFFMDTFNDYTYDDSCPGYLPNVEKTITNVEFTKFAADTYYTQYNNTYHLDWLTDTSITEPYELYDALCENATCQWQGKMEYKQGGYEPVVGDIIIFSDIKYFDNADPTHYVSGVVYQDGWYITTRTSLYSVICSGESSCILMDIQKKFGTDYRYATIFTIN